MGSLLILIVLIAYFSVLYLISLIVARKGTSNEAFFIGNRKSPWWTIAIGMIGTSISAVSFVSVPGWVRETDMSYMKMVFGLFLGYLFIAFVLLSLYYRLNLITIYGYLKQRFGDRTYKTGSFLFILSKLIGAAARLYIAIMILQSLVFTHWGIPFYITVIGIVFFLWLYTYRGGIKTIIWTDLFQTICLIMALILIIWQVSMKLDLNFGGTVSSIINNEHSHIFVFDDWGSKQNFFKQFFSGIFISIVMTGLDQDMMQKNLTCKNIKDAKKNMTTYGAIMILVNLLFLSLGVLLLIYTSKNEIDLPDISDQILPQLLNGEFGALTLVFFIVGITSAAFSSADSALTALTTTTCVDLLNINDKKNTLKAKKIRLVVHGIMSLMLIIIIVIINSWGQSSIIEAIYKIASYTYGPLLGLFFFGLLTKTNVKDKYVPIICILSPLFCFIIEILLINLFNYKTGNEILMLNGLLTMLGLLLIYKKKPSKDINI